MHELSVTQELLELVGRSVPQGQLHLVREIKVRVGMNGHLLPDSLEFCYEAIKGEFGLSAARMEIIKIPVTARCKTCGLRFEVQENRYLCSGCGSSSLTVLTGNELHLSELILDDE